MQETYDHMTGILSRVTAALAAGSHDPGSCDLDTFASVCAVCAALRDLTQAREILGRELGLVPTRSQIVVDDLVTNAAVS